MPATASFARPGPRAAARLRWIEHVAEYERSSLTQRSFCDRHELALSSFVRWRRRLELERSDCESAFVAVTIAESTTMHQTEAGLSDGVRVTLPCGLCIDGVTVASVPTVAALVRAL